MAEGNDGPTDEQDRRTIDTDSLLSRRRLLTVAGAGIVGSALVSSAAASDSPDRLEIVAPRGSEVEYTFTCAGRIERVEGNSFVSANPNEDAITENDDGTWTAGGYTGDGYGDAFDVEGDVLSFEPADGEYLLYLNGELISHEDLVQPPTKRLVIETPEDGSVEYTFTTTGRITKDLDNGRNSAEEDNDTITENDDGTWTATGLTGNGYGDTFEFEGEVTAFSPTEGTFTLYLDGQETSVYELTGEEPPDDREHSYSFEATGDTWADYYLEVEDGGDLIASTLDGAVIRPDYHWISEDGTKAAGRVHPGERNAYEFDNLVLDVTIEGEADAFVDDQESSVDRYPQPGATGDEWKGGFPWQEEEDDEEDEEETTPDGLAMGGGPGYDAIVTRSDADVVVETASGLSDALSSASSGDVVFVPGDAVIETGETRFDVPAGVTLASNRGENGSQGALLRTDDEPDAVIRMAGADARLTGLRLRGPYPDTDVTYQDGISYSNDNCDGVVVSGANCEIDNNEVAGFVHAGVFVEHNGDGGQHVHHNYVHQNNTQGLGYGVSVGIGSSLNPTIEYNYFDENRHSVTASGDNYGYVCRYNHFGPTSVMAPIDIHDPGAQDTTIEHNVVETLTRTWDDNCCPAIDGFEGTDGVVRIRENWFWNDSCTFDVPTDDSNIEVSDNDHGEDASVALADVIPDHPGADHRPWA
ncbi:MAG: right-handed parallel beta-helix repeat-containing protein [Halanaeroarchaeum sp.]